MLRLSPHESSVCCRAVKYQQLFCVQPELFRGLISGTSVSIKRIATALATGIECDGITNDEMEVVTVYRQWVGIKT